jgi:hypothetical protein
MSTNTNVDQERPAQGRKKRASSREDSDVPQRASQAPRNDAPIRPLSLGTKSGSREISQRPVRNVRTVSIKMRITATEEPDPNCIARKEAREDNMRAPVKNEHDAAARNILVMLLGKFPVLRRRRNVIFTFLERPTLTFDAAGTRQDDIKFAPSRRRGAAGVNPPPLEAGSPVGSAGGSEIS